MYVIGASVHVADARPQELHHAKAQKLLARIAAEGQVVYLPMIVLAEVAAAISRGTGRPILARRLTAALLRVTLSSSSLSTMHWVNWQHRWQPITRSAAPAQST